MYLKQIILFVNKLLILIASTTSGFEIVSTTERGVDKDNSCNQEMIKTLGKLGSTWEEQQNFWIKFYNNSYEFQIQKQLEQTQKQLVQVFDKKLEEVEAKFASKQLEILEKLEDMRVVNKKLEIKQQEILNKIENNSSYDQKVEERKVLPRDCLEILRSGNSTSGIYTIQPVNASTRFDVQCNMHSQGGGWTYVLNRFDGSQEFYLDWQNYKKGFGKLSGEFWLGLQYLYELTGSVDNYLLVELTDWEDKYYYAIYSAFRIGSEEEGYPIKVLSGYSGDAGDSLTYHKNSKFSTYDRDQDKVSGNCAKTHHGAWWYNECYYSNLAGTYSKNGINNVKGMTWFHVKSSYLSFKKATMMVKPHY